MKHTIAINRKAIKMPNQKIKNKKQLLSSENFAIVFKPVSFLAFYFLVNILINGSN
jgi:hypothetical protein